MISEKQIAELFSSLLPSGRSNACFESDAEIINLPGNPNCLFTTDEFSAEDLFREDQPYLLGWNIAAGAISDILACGGAPLYYAHALTVSPTWDVSYLHKFGIGVRDVLTATGARFIGGDCGRSEAWRCTASVIGTCEGNPVRRRGAAVGDAIYFSGQVGAGNLEAALRLHQSSQYKASSEIQTQFCLRLRESAVMRKFASCCIDTSDGVCAGLNTLADLNGCGYEVCDMPYLAAGVHFCQQVSLPKTLLALGECGEYELLFTIKPEREEAFLEEARKAGCVFHRLGKITQHGRQLNENDLSLDLGSWQDQARNFESVSQYLDALIRWLSHHQVQSIKASTEGGSQMQKRVVITGIGPVTSAGVGKEDFFRRIWSGSFNAKPFPVEFCRSHPLHSQWYVQLPEVSLSTHGVQTTLEKLMQEGDRLAVLAAKLALEDAGFALVKNEGKLTFPGGAETGVVLGIGLGGMQIALPSYLSHCIPQEMLQVALPERRSTFNRMVVPRTMPNSPAAWISICFGLNGPVFTINASCASGTYAIGEAFRRIKDGYEEILLTGGVECLQEQTGFMMRGFDVLGVLTQSSDGRPCPFGQDRSGFLFAEGGACLLVLEEAEHALKRRAPIYAEISDFRANSDAFAPVLMDPGGKQITQLLAQLATGRKIDYLNAHGTGTVVNDELEAKAIRSVFGERQSQPWINSTKGILGHTIGASGAIEAAVTALSIARGTVHPNLTVNPLPELNLPLEVVNQPIKQAISVSYGFGGHNGGLLLTRFDSPQDQLGKGSNRG